MSWQLICLYLSCENYGSSTPFVHLSSSIKTRSEICLQNDWSAVSDSWQKVTCTGKSLFDESSTENSITKKDVCHLFFKQEWTIGVQTFVNAICVYRSVLAFAHVNANLSVTQFRSIFLWSHICFQNNLPACLTNQPANQTPKEITFTPPRLIVKVKRVENDHFQVFLRRMCGVWWCQHRSNVFWVVISALMHHICEITWQMYGVYSKPNAFLWWEAVGVCVCVWDWGVREP